MQKPLFAVLFLASSLPCFAQYQPVSNFCVMGATQAQIGTSSSSNSQQGIYPNCKVSVNLAGTSSPAVIYSSASSSSPLTQPFTAAADGHWTFYANPNACYDVTLSDGLATPVYTYSLMYLCPKLPSQGDRFADLYPTLQAAIQAAPTPPDPAHAQGGLVRIGPQNKSVFGLPAFNLFPDSITVTDYRYSQLNQTFFNTSYDLDHAIFGRYYAAYSNCTWNKFLHDGEGYQLGQFHLALPGDTCNQINLTNDVKGESYGNPNSTAYPHEQSWSSAATLTLSHMDFMQGIISGISSTLAHFSAGDTLGLDQTIITKGGNTANSDEAVEGFRNRTQEADLYTATFDHEVIVKASSQEALTMTSPSAPPGQGFGSAILNANPLKLKHLHTEIDGGSDLLFLTFLVKNPDGSAAADLPLSITGALSSRVHVGPLTTMSYSATNWSVAGASTDSTATATIYFPAGRLPPAVYPDSAGGKTVVYLNGFTCAGVPFGMNHTAMEIDATDGSTWISGQIPYGGSGVSCATSESGGSVTTMSLGHMPGSTTLPVNVVAHLASPCGGASQPLCFDNSSDAVFFEDIFPEQSNAACTGCGVSAEADGSYILTLPLRYEHPVGTPISQHGYAGYRMNLTAFSPDTAPYVQYVASSTVTGGEGYLRAGYVQEGNLSHLVEPSDVTLYPGADIDGVTDPATGTADWTYILAQPGGHFETGDAAIQPSQMAFQWRGNLIALATSNPYVYATAADIEMPGASTRNNSVFNVSLLTGQSAGPSGLGVLGGNPYLQAPGILASQGLFSSFFHSYTPPVGSTGVTPSFFYMDSCWKNKYPAYSGQAEFSLWNISLQGIGQLVTPCSQWNFPSWQISASAGGKAVATLNFTGGTGKTPLVGEVIQLAGMPSAWPTSVTQLQVSGVNLTSFTAVIDYSGGAISGTGPGSGTMNRSTLQSQDLSVSGTVSAGGLSSAGLISGGDNSQLIYTGGARGVNGITWTLADRFSGQVSMGKAQSGTGVDSYIEEGFMKAGTDGATGQDELAIGHNFSDNGMGPIGGGSGKVVDFYVANHQGIGIGSGTTVVPAGEIQFGYGGTTVDQSSGRVSAPIFRGTGFATDAKVGLPLCANPLGDIVTGCTTEDHQTFSATPVIDPNIPLTTILLTGDITGFTFSPAPVYGQQITLMFCQDSAGSHTVTPPVTGIRMHGFFTVGSTPNMCNVQTFLYSGLTNAWMATGPGMINE